VYARELECVRARTRKDLPLPDEQEAASVVDRAVACDRPASPRPRLRPLHLLLLAAIATVGCDGDDDEACDAALAVVCSCATVDCASKDAPQVVEKLRRCERDEIEVAYHLPHCIESAGEDYCAVIDGLTQSDRSICGVACNFDAACDMQNACETRQYHDCEAAP
jgi:hypothetical protein